MQKRGVCKTIKPCMATHAQGEGAGEGRKPWLQQFLLRGFMDTDGSGMGIALAKRYSNKHELLL